MTAGTKGEDPDVVSREVLLDPGASRTLGGDWTVELSGRTRACTPSLTPCETIVEARLLGLAAVLREFDEDLEVERDDLVDCSVMMRCFDLLGICLAMDHVKGACSWRRKVKNPA